MLGLVAAVLLVVVIAAQIRLLGALRRRWFRRVVALSSVAMAVGAATFVAHPYVTDVQAGRRQEELGSGFGSAEHRLAYEACLRTGFAHPACTIGEGDGLTRIRSAAIGLDVIVVEGVGATALRAGAGHYPSTAAPCATGNVGIAGHRTTYGHPFHDLDRLRPGDAIELDTPVGSCRYTVTSREVVAPTDVRVIGPTDDAQLTLTTCHPKGSARERLVVHAVLG